MQELQIDQPNGQINGGRSSQVSSPVDKLKFTFVSIQILIVRGELV